MSEAINGQEEDRLRGGGSGQAASGMGGRRRAWPYLATLGGLAVFLGTFFLPQEACATALLRLGALALGLHASELVLRDLGAPSWRGLRWLPALIVLGMAFIALVCAERWVASR